MSVTPPLINTRNLLRLGSTALGYLVAWSPSSWDLTLVPRLVETQASRSRLLADIESRMREFFGAAGIDSDPDVTAAEYVRTYRELQWLRCRALANREVSNLHTELQGGEHIDRALGEGCGVVLWGMHFCGFLVVKIALHKAGVQLVHLSTASHGAGNPPTRFGLHTLARVYRLPEDRYLAERIVIPQDGTQGYLRLLKQRLEENRCLWILGEAAARHSNVEAPFFTGRRRIATGAPALAWRTGARLLPTVTVRTGNYHYRVVVGEPLESDARNKQDFVESMVLQFAKHLEQRIREYPAYWNWPKNAQRWLVPENPNSKR